MEELSIEEKAKRYDEALEKAKIWQEHLYDVNDKDYADELNYIFPELKESEDERTWIINYLSNRILNSTIIAEKENLKKAIAWLERQGKQKPVEMKSAEESLGIDSETYSKVVDECIYGEQKSANKVEPKFKVGDYIKPIDKCLGSPRIIEEVYDGWYVTDKGALYFEFEDNWELVEKPAWSEEDERILKEMIKIFGLENFEGYNIGENNENALKFLNSLKERYTWKPSDEQMEALDEVYKTHGANNVCRRVLFNLMNDLKKLREE